MEPDIYRWSCPIETENRIVGRPYCVCVSFSRGHGGASAIMRKDGEHCCSRNSFLWEDNLQLGNRPFYVPPSPVIGCHWSCVRGKRLHGSFPDFPGDSFSHCILRLCCSNRCATVGFLIKKEKEIRKIPTLSFHQRPVWCYLRHKSSPLLLDDKRSVSTFSWSHLVVYKQQQQQQKATNPGFSRKHPRMNMDYLLVIGKICMRVETAFLFMCMLSLTASCFISHVN